MAKVRISGYCPKRIVEEEIVKKHLNIRLFCLWSVLGKKIICVDDESRCTTVNPGSIKAMFTTDPIAYRLMLELISKNDEELDCIKIRQIHNGGYNFQKLEDLGKLLVNVKNPKVLTKVGSRFIIVISETNYDLEMYFWDLNYCLI